MRAVQYSEYGPASVMSVVDVADPSVGADEVLVRVVAVGLNPVDYLVRLGQRQGIFEVTFPSGIGSDFAGVIERVGESVTGYLPGDEVLGSTIFASLAELVSVPSAVLAYKPARLDWNVAGALTVAGLTAFDAVESQSLTPDDIVLVSAAAGAVGSIIAQLAVRAGATVVGSASPGNHELLRSLGVLPVAYGASLVAAVRELAPDGVTVAFDQWGDESIAAALELGVDPDRINTVATDPKPWGVRRVGRRGPNPERLSAIVDLVAEGELVIPIDSVWTFHQVIPAFERAEGRHVHGRVVVRVSEPETRGTNE